MLRIVLEGNKLKAVLYSVDQGGRAEPATTITRSRSTIRVIFAATGITYEGELRREGDRGNVDPGYPTAAKAGACYTGNRVGDSGPSQRADTDVRGCYCRV